ncbi:MAG TPA: fibronectin type III domain-containing protein [Mycobacteriales bacterium]|nr:fibronectin type III domain-containing protein [Mycobacteriales bacterium]
MPEGIDSRLRMRLGGAVAALLIVLSLGVWAAGSGGTPAQPSAGPGSVPATTPPAGSLTGPPAEPTAMPTDPPTTPTGRGAAPDLPAAAPLPPIRPKPGARPPAAPPARAGAPGTGTPGTGAPPRRVPPPGAATGLRVTAVGASNVSLCWAAAARADGYSLYYRDATAEQAWTRMPYPINPTCYTAQHALTGHLYQFKIRGGNSAGEGPDSNVVQAIPSRPRPGTPTGLRAAAGAGSVRLCWTAAPGADGYSLYYRDATAKQAWTRMPYPINATCYTVQHALAGHLYQFKIRGGNAAGEGPDSNVAQATPHA